MHLSGKQIQTQKPLDFCRELVFYKEILIAQTTELF